MAVRWAGNNKTQIRVSASVLVPTATSFHCLKAKCDIWVKGRPCSILPVTSFPLVPWLLLSSEVHLQIPLAEWKCLSLVCFKQICPILSSSILCSRLSCIIWIYPPHRHKEHWPHVSQAAEEQRIWVTWLGTREMSTAVSEQNPHHKTILLNFSLRFKVVFFEMFLVSNTEGQRHRMMDFLACLLPC